MPFLQTHNDQLPPLAPGGFSAGPTSGFADNFSQFYEQQYRVDSMFALEAELLDRHNQNINRVKELTGEDFSSQDFAGYDYFGAVARRALGKDPKSAVISEEETKRMLADFDQREARLRELKEQFPEIQTFDEIFADVRKQRQDILRRSSVVAETSDVWGTLGSIAGGIAGSFSWRDPLLLGSLPFGGGGRTIALRILTEAGIGAGTEAVQQFGFVQPTQEALGEEGTNPWASIAFAAGGSALLRGGFEAVGPGFRAAERQLFPDRAQARVFRDTMEEALQAPLAEVMQRLRPQRLSDAELMAAVRSLPQTPTVRAAGHALDVEASVRAANPYGSDRPAWLRLERELEITQRQLDGQDLPTHLRSDTAIGRFTEQRLGALEADTPEAMIGRLEAPEVYRQLDEGNVRLAAVEARVAELQTALDERTMADAVGLLDEVSGLRVREIENELDRPLPRARREALERELDQIVESIGPERIAKAERDARIGPERQLRDARRGRTAVQKELRKWRKAAAEVETRVAKQAGQVDLVRNVLNPEVQARQVARDTSVRLDEAEAAQPQVTEAIVQRNVVEEVSDTAVAPGETPIPRPSGIDVGADTLIPEDFIVALDAEGKVTMTAREFMDDLNEDTKLLAAMKECSI